MPEFFITEVVALGLRLPRASASARCRVSAWALALIMWAARRERRSLSASRPFSSMPTYFLAMSAMVTWPPPIMRAPPWPERSCCSRRLPMVQPPFIGPTMSFFSTRAPVKKVSHWPEAPEIIRIGRASTLPG